MNFIQISLLSQLSCLKVLKYEGKLNTLYASLTLSADTFIFTKKLLKFQYCTSFES